MLDQQVINLAKAIAKHESGGNYKAKGGSGEFGAYQFMPSTWKSWAKKYLGDANAKMDKINQNKVAYYRILDWKNQGYNPGQIASLWNSGSANWQGKMGVNKYGIKYNVPKYVENVYSLFKKFSKLV
jgi:soluble lytic murein transglycosylase-like protein